jgi:glutamate carboxypeptidase
MSTTTTAATTTAHAGTATQGGRHDRASSLRFETPPVAELQQLAAWTEERFATMRADIESLVQLETPSTDKALLDQALHWLVQRAHSVLGEPARTERVVGGERGDIQVLTYDGDLDATVTMLCHYDTVWDGGTLNDWPVQVEGDVMTGPGVFDMKAGCIQAIWAIAALKENGIPHPTLHLQFTGDEEIGSEASRTAIERYALDSDLLMVLEPSENGRIKTARKGIGRFSAHITGRAAHAGAHYTDGVSAIDEMARLVRTLHDLTDLSAGTTVNVGIVSGGTRSNVVAASCSADVDVRVTSESEMERIDAAFAALRPHHSQAVLELSGGWNRPPMERSELTTVPFEAVRTVGSVLGYDLGEVAVGGGSDGNFAAALGVPVLDGMGAVGGNPHAAGEYIEITASLQRTAVAAGVLASVRAR